MTEEDMRFHARSRHRMEYQAHMETLAAQKGDEVAELRQRLDALMLAQTQPAKPVTVSEKVTQPTPTTQKGWTPERRAEASKRAKARFENTKPAMA